MKRETKNIDLELLMHKHLTNQASQDEARIVEDILSKDNEESRDAEAITKAWDKSIDAMPKMKFDSSKAFSKFKDSIAADLEETKSTSKVVEMTSKKQSKVFTLSRMIAVAAVFAGLFVVGSIMMNGNETFKSSNTNLAISLDDGSKINAAPNSTLKVTGDRSIDFDGNGYFDIHHDEDKPFTISLDDAQVQVLGTSFVIEERDNDTYVSLESGRVLVNKKGESVSLVPGEYAKITSNGLIKASVDSENAYSLKNGFLTFEETSLRSVIQDFERHFNTSLLVDKTAELDYCTLTASKVSSKNAIDAAKIIATIYDADVEVLTDGSIKMKNIECK